MTATECLSARIAALEAEATFVADGLRAIEVLEDELLDLKGRINAIRFRVIAGERAQRILDYLAEQTEKVLAGGELIRGTDCDLPPAVTIAAALDDSAATIHTALDVVQNNSESNSEPIRNELNADPDPSPIAETTTTEQTPADTTKTVLSDSANSSKNSTELPVNALLSTVVDSPITSREKLKAWLATLPSGVTFTTTQLAEATRMNPKTASVQLSQGVNRGDLERVPDTYPVEYRLAGQAIADPEPSPPAEVAQDEEKQTEPAETSEATQNPEPVIPLPDAENQVSGLTIVENSQAAPTSVTELMQEQLLGALRQYGQPLPASALAGRLKKSGFDMYAVNATAALLMHAGKVSRLPDGRYSVAKARLA